MWLVKNRRRSVHRRERPWESRSTSAVCSERFSLCLCGGVSIDKNNNRSNSNNSKNNIGVSLFVFVISVLNFCSKFAIPYWTQQRTVQFDHNVTGAILGYGYRNDSESNVHKHEYNNSPYNERYDVRHLATVNLRRRQEQASVAPLNLNRNSSKTSKNNNSVSNSASFRILYCVTSINEYDNGRRQTKEGYDRFRKLLVPVVRESVQSLIGLGVSSQRDVEDDMTTIETPLATVVDVVLITHYTVSAQRYEQLRQALTFANGTVGSVGLYVWDDATPLGYDITEGAQGQQRLESLTRSLARQHRFVIKDHFWNYDLFLNFEDDMIVRHSHIDQFLKMSRQLYQLRSHAPIVLYNQQQSTTNKIHGKKVLSTNNQPKLMNVTDALQSFYGTMTEKSISRLIPGFIRVEVVPADFQVTAAFLHDFISDEVPVDYNYYDQYTNISRNNNSVVIDASVCCSVSEQTVHDTDGHLLQRPTADRLRYWETSIEALGVRKMPPPSLLPSSSLLNKDRTTTFMDWVVLLGGNKEEAWDDPKYIVGDFWSGDVQRNQAQYFSKTFKRNIKQSQRQIQFRRPDKTIGQYASNQGGWMATPFQLMEFHLRWCRGGFLPPYNAPYYRLDGLDHRTVEYWSGAIQIAGANSCNLQRIVSLQPKQFSRHLLYHASNNKQNSPEVQYHYSRRSIQEFWGQLNTIRKNAERYMHQEQQQTQIV